MFILQREVFTKATKSTKNPSYSLEFKQDAAKLVLEKGHSCQKAADHLGVSLSALSRWVKAERLPNVAVVIDLFSRQVVGWAMDNHMKTSLCVSALQMAFWRRKPAKGLIHHSDRGSQYASKEYREHLAIMGMEQSMSRKGNCWDNAPTERFFRSLKYEQLHYERFRTVAEAKLSVIDYLAFYNGKRIHSTLGYKSPLAFEQDFLRQAA